MKTLATGVDVEELRGRLAALTANDEGLWGSMNAGEMVCHVRDAYKLSIAGRELERVPGPPIPLRLFKWIALNGPMQWPQGVQTVPEVDQRLGGTRPVEFGADLDGLVSALEAFVGFRGRFIAHPIFGPLTGGEWMRWGYLHTDHHLRQFGR